VDGEEVVVDQTTHMILRHPILERASDTQGTMVQPIRLGDPVSGQARPLGLLVVTSREIERQIDSRIGATVGEEVEADGAPVRALVVLALAHLIRGLRLVSDLRRGGRWFALHKQNYVDK